MTQVLNWIYKVSEVPSNGMSAVRHADEAERAAVANALKLQALENLEVRYRISPTSRDGYRLDGDIVAEVEQACIVTLEPIRSSVKEPFEVEFVRDAKEVPASTDEQSVLSGVDIDKLENDAIPLGRIVFETLSGAIDPYPRKPEAEFSWRDNAASAGAEGGPFGVLAKLKREH